MKVQEIFELALQEQVALSVKDGRLVAATAAGGMSETLRARIRDNKEALTRYLASMETLYPKKLPPMGLRPAGLPAPASFAQMRLWFLDQLEGGSSQYNNVMQLGLEGRLDVARLRDAFGALVARHEILRTSLREDDGDVCQVVGPARAFVLQVVALDHLDADAQDRETGRLARLQAQQPFDLSADLMLRAMVLRLAGDEHVLLLAMHHIASDGWSMGIVIRELSELYSAQLAGRPHTLAPLPVQYADYASWQRGWLRDEVLERHLGYWRRQLQGLPAVHGFPLDNERGPRQTFAGRSHPHFIASGLLGQLKVLCQRHDVTLFMLLQSAFAVMLHRYSNDADIVMGTPIAGRVSQEVNGLIGFFVNTLVLRSDLGGNPPFSDVLRQNRQMLLDAFTHQHIPFEMLVDELKPQRSLQHAALFQISFALQNMDKGEFGLSGLKAKPAGAAQEVAKFDLELVACEVADGLVLHWNHNADLFEASTMERAARNFEVLLGAIVADAGAPIRDLPLVSEPERLRMLVEWNGTQTAWRSDQCIHELFEAQAARTPDAIAVECGDERMSYAELNSMANQLAHYLVTLGVRADEMVGLCLERSPAMVVGMLSIVKAGGAYVPLDPAYPVERLRFMLDDAALRLVVTGSGLEALLALPASSAVCVDWRGALAAPRSCGPATNLARDERGLDPARLAYVIYTSGSTGQPKGVMISHAGVVNHMQWMVDEFAIGPHDVVLQRTAYSFDASVWEFWVPLVCGARLVLADATEVKQLEVLAARIAASGVTVLQAVPAMLGAVLQLLPDGGAAALRLIFCGGDVLTPQLRNAVRSRLPDGELVNLYGPTEATIDATAWRDRGALDGQVRIPIGRPIRNTRLYVLDDALRLLPQGAAGELCIAGAGLARGYLGRAELTAQRFVTNLHAADPDERIYRTGDLVRWRTDGNVEFLGRLDHQVKIRGFRIELGEIEHRLRALEGVREAVVLAPAHEDGTRQLAAYVVPRRMPQGVAERGELIGSYRATLQNALPKHMVPAVYVFLDAMPLSANGKVDRSSLPASTEGDRHQHAYAPPRNAVELALCGIWQDVLSLEQVGIHDNFFSLGGDSIVSIQVVSRARKQHLGLTVRALFEHQNIASLAKAVTAGPSETASQDEVGGALAMLPIQRDFFARALARPNHYNQALLLTCPARFSLDALRAIVLALYARHDALRVRYDTGEPGQAVAHHVPLDARTLEASLCRHDLSALDEGACRAALAQLCADAQAGLDIACGPLLKAVHFDYGPGREGRVLWVIHHLAVDGVSWRILLADLDHAWRQIEEGHAVALDPKSAAFQQWGAALALRARSTALQAERPFWLAQLAAGAPALAWAGTAASAVAGGAAMPAQATMTLSAAHTRALLGLANLAYRTRVEELLLAALLRAWRQCSGAASLCVELEGHGREEVIGLDVSDTVGWFTSAYPLLLDGPPELDGLIKAVKERARQVPHKGIGYGILRSLGADEDLQAGERARADSKVVFNYLGQFDNSLNGRGGFGRAAEDSGPASDPRNASVECIGINGMVQDGCLTFFVQSARMDTAALEQLARALHAALEDVVTHCTGAQPQFTPADFPNARVEAAQLARLQQRYPQLQALYRATPLQSGMLYHAMLDQGGSAYTSQICCDLVGDVDTRAFEAAWRQALRRHGVLRTCFVGFEHEQIHQLVDDGADLRMFEQDWSGASGEAQVAALQRYREQDKARGFDYGQAPLMRISLLKQSAARHHFVWTHHHALMDGWSVPLLLQEVLELYQSAVQGRPAQVSDVVPYEDYIAALYSQDREQALAGWRAHLEGFDSATVLGVELPPGASPAGGELALAMSEAVSRGLNALARATQCTLNVVLQAAWSLLLHRYSGESDVVFGTTLSGRMAWVPGIESMVGLFINTVPVRACFGPAMTLENLLRQLHEGGIWRDEHGYVSLAEIQGASALGTGVPLFDSLLVLENYPAGKPAAAMPERGFVIERVHADEHTSYGVTLSAHCQGILTIKLLYRRDRYTADSMERLLGHFEQILSRLAGSDGACRLDQIDMLGEAEQRQLLDEWSASLAAAPGELCLHELFEQQAARTPDAPAVVDGALQLSYAELNVRANVLAHRLVALGVRAETLVGLCLERSAGMLVAILGILKAGGAYVPIDPHFPEERVRYMLDDSGVALVVTREALLAQLPPGSRRAVCLDDCVGTGAPFGTAANLPRAQRGLDAGSLAYVIYTSGSTGTPKGTLVEHRGVVNLAARLQEAFGITARSRVLQFSVAGFDAMVWEWTTALTCGAPLLIVPEAERYALERVGAFIDRHQVSHALLPPAMLSQEAAGTCRSLRVLFLGGEAVDPHTVAAARRFFPQAAIANAYGPTENSVCSTVGLLGEPDGGAHVPIGRPLGNVTCYVAGPDGRHLAPVGVAGELYVGGVGLARGYLGRAGLTAEKFIPNPFTGTPGDRVYKTGDLVRWHSDGTLAFVGRIDQQVKIRGFRIELGEIEQRLLGLVEVREAAVLARTQPAAKGGKYLAAYVALRQAPAGAAERTRLAAAIRAGLRQVLPDYMVPAVYVLLDSLPLTANGKIDRSKLPEPAQDDWSSAAFIGPRTGTERALCAIWQDVLGLDEVGVRDSFFELGGHSLMATRLVGRIAQQFGVELALREVFQDPTVEALARLVDEGEGSRGAAAPPIVRTGADDGLPLSFAQQRLWFIDRLGGGSSQYNVPAVIALEGELRLECLQAALGRIVERHEVLRTRFEECQGDVCQRIAPAGLFPLDVSSLEALAGALQDAEVQRLAAQEAAAPFDLGSDLMLRAHVLRLGAQRHVLLLTLHHIASDGWSLGIFVKELSALYGALVEGRADLLAPLPVQYGDYARWQRDWLQGAVLDEQLDYWKQQLAGLPQVHSFPLDHERPPTQTFCGRTHHQLIGAQQLAQLKALCGAQDVTLFMLLHTAFGVLLHRYSNAADIVIGTPIAGRARPEVHGLIGFFVNTLVLRSDLGGNPGFLDALHRNRKTLLDAYIYQDLPFEMLVDELKPQRSLQHGTLFQIMFNLQNQEQGEIALSGLSARPYSPAGGVAKFDLELAACECADGLALQWHYNSDLFEDDTIVRVARNFGVLIGSIIADPGCAVRDLLLLSGVEAQRLIVEWNATGAPFARDKCIHEFIEEQAARTPDAIAVISEHGQLSYADLNRRANQLAHCLAAHGVTPDSLVGLCVERSLEMVIGMLGILKAGGAYVPIDAAYPPERIAYMLDDAGVALVVSQRFLVGQLPLGGRRTVCLDAGDADAALLAGYSGANLETAALGLRPDHLAYVIYTSGSTGNPKGSLLCHRSIVNLLVWYVQRFALAPADTALIISSLSFDLTQKNIFGPLMAGGRISIYASREYEVQAIVAQIARDAVTFINCAPSSFYPLIAGKAGREHCATLRTVLLGGEAVNLKLLRPWMEARRDEVRLVNMYGPSECADIALFHEIAEPPSANQSTLPIGRPNWNVKCVVLDERARPVPIGVTGELYVGGEGLARGYLNQEAMTREKFVANAVPGLGGSVRLYRTGDLVRWNAGGDVEFIGRADHQVKIRGFRVELGEVEHKLRSHPDVAEAVVLLQSQAEGEAAGDVRLVAYVVAAAGAAPQAGSDAIADYRRYLGRLLPPFMVPAGFILLCAFPLSPNGKIDRAALAARRDVVLHQARFVAPRNELESTLCVIWCAMFALDRVGVEDDFFELGGHSLLIARLISEVRAHLGVELTIRDVFAAPTISGLGACLLPQVRYRALEDLNASGDNQETEEIFIE